MTARASIAANDGETSPVTHTFAPDGVTPGGAENVFVNRNATVPAASERLFISILSSPAQPQDYSIPGKSVQPRRVVVRLRYPATYVDANSGLTLVDYVDECDVSFKIHPRASEQRAKNLRMLAANALNSGAMMMSAIDKGEKIW